jgi:protein-disulfide isomerase
MLRSLFVLLAAALALAAAPADPKAEPKKASAFDKPALEAYVRHLFVLSPQLKVEVLDPEPADLPGFQKVVVRASNGSASQDIPFYVTKDGQKIVQANVWEIASNPFKAQLDKLKTEFQPSFGTPGATVVLVVFSDFECPFCKEEATTLRQNLLSAYPTQVRLYFKDYPLESIHTWAKTAAIAGRCVFRQSPADYFSYHDWMFAHQSENNALNLKAKVLEWAKTAPEINQQQLEACIDTKATEDEVNRSIAEGKALGINSTPTLFVNGRTVAERVDWPTLRAIIDNELEYQKTAKNAGEDCGCELKVDMPGLTKPGAATPSLKR